MNRFSLSQLTDQALDRGLASVVGEDHATTASLLAYLAEADLRRRFAVLGYESMFAFCVRGLHMSEDVAYKRIRVARLVREHAVILPAVAEGRVSLSALLLLSAHLTAESATGLIEAATHLTNAQVEVLIAERFPQPDLATLVQPLPTPTSAGELAVRRVVPSGLPQAPEEMEPLPQRSRPAPLSPGRFALQFTISQAVHDKLRRAKELLGHAVAPGDLEAVLDCALETLIESLEKQKFARTDHPRRPRKSSNPRYIPAQVKRAVRERDGDQCTFRSEAGVRCGARFDIEFDHIQPVARGGQSTVDNLRLRCRAHNRLEADRAYGERYMNERQQHARDVQQKRARARAQAFSGSQVVRERQRRHEPNSPYGEFTGRNRGRRALGMGGGWALIHPYDFHSSLPRSEPLPYAT